MKISGREAAAQASAAGYTPGLYNTTTLGTIYIYIYIYIYI